MFIVGIIPARYKSTRFPGKPLAEISGKTMIQRVYEQAKKCSLLSKIIVATDDKEIFEHVITFGGKAVMTKENHASGTERCNEVAKKKIPICRYYYQYSRGPTIYRSRPNINTN